MKDYYKRPIPMLSAAVVALLLTLFTSCYVHDTRLEHRFGTVTQGMHEQEVLSLLGKPDRSGPCGQLGGFPAGCSREYLYGAKLPTITTWAVFFDERGTVLDTYRYESP
jgi:hypothetical protein